MTKFPCPAAPGWPECASVLVVVSNWRVPMPKAPAGSLSDHESVGKRLFVPQIRAAVKGGKVQREMVATLKGDMQREGAVSGILVTLEEPTGPMRSEAADACKWNSEMHESRSYPVIQLITVAQLLAGDSPDLPRWGISTFRKASGAKRNEHHPELFADNNEN